MVRRVCNYRFLTMGVSTEVLTQRVLNAILYISCVLPMDYCTIQEYQNHTKKATTPYYWTVAFIHLFVSIKYLTANPFKSSSVIAPVDNLSSHDLCAPDLTAALTIISRLALLDREVSVSDFNVGLE